MKFHDLILNAAHFTSLLGVDMAVILALLMRDFKGSLTPGTMKNGSNNLHNIKEDTEQYEHKILA
jgi:hypothetical protein